MRMWREFASSVSSSQLMKNARLKNLTDAQILFSSPGKSISGRTAVLSIAPFFDKRSCDLSVVRFTCPCSCDLRIFRQPVKEWKAVWISECVVRASTPFLFNSYKDAESLFSIILSIVLF